LLVVHYYGQCNYSSSELRYILQFVGGTTL